MIQKSALGSFWIFVSLFKKPMYETSNVIALEKKLFYEHLRSDLVNPMQLYFGLRTIQLGKLLRSVMGQQKSPGTRALKASGNA